MLERTSAQSQHLLGISMVQYGILLQDEGILKAGQMMERKPPIHVSIKVSVSSRQDQSEEHMALQDSKWKD
jgi:hypothetical protein